MQIYLVRHPQTTGGNDVRYFGATDLDLSDLGRRQKDALAERFHGVPLDAIVSSPMRRAWQTAEAIAELHDLTPIRVPAFAELNFGIWEGLDNDEIRQQYPDLYKKWLVRDGTFQYPEGDSVPGFRERVLSGLDAVTDRDLSSTVLVVGHAGVNRILLSQMMEVGWGSFWSMELSLAGISQVEFDGEHYKLALLNDICHLAGL